MQPISGRTSSVAEAMSGVERGRLSDPSSAPVAGERAWTLARLGVDVEVEQILSGALAAPTDYRQDHDEWVVLLAGAAHLEVESRTIEMTPGDWVLLPAGTPHRLAWTQPSSSWLAVHFGRSHEGKREP